MPLSITELYLVLPALALVFFRLVGLMITAPLFSSSVIPRRVRAAMVMVLAAMIFPMVAAKPGVHDASLSTVVVGGATELMIGAAVGLSLTILLMGAQVAGEMISQQAGLSLGEVINPLFDANVSVLTQVYAMTVTFFFLLADGHRAMMAALLDTFSVIPVLSYAPGDSIVLLLVEAVSSAFIFGVRLAAPVVIALFLTETALALLSRTMPQLNILSVGFSLRVMIALAVGALTLTAGESTLLRAIGDGLDLTRAALGLSHDSWSVRT